MLLNKYNKALEELKKIEKSNFECIEKDIIYEFLAYAYFENGDNLKSAYYYMESLKINPKNFFSKYNLSNIYIKTKDYKKAYNILNELKEVEPENETIKKNLALLEEKLNVN